jgi:mannose-6-phosphate isomerase-like protein (cupin superfamily)
MEAVEKLISISDFTGEGYQPLVDFGSWRVAVLRYIDELLPEKINNIECHLETDEVFILIEGRCILFLADVEIGQITKFHAIDMVPGKLYTVKMGVYHTHTLSQDAHVIIVENRDTGSDNSNRILLDQSQGDEICALTRKLW